MSRQHRRLPSLLLASGFTIHGLQECAQPIRIAGANFRQDVGYAVYFGSFRATAVTILDTSTLLVVTPQHEPSPVDVVVEYRPRVQVVPEIGFDWFSLSGHIRWYFGGRRS